MRTPLRGVHNVSNGFLFTTRQRRPHACGTNPAYLLGDRITSEGSLHPYSKSVFVRQEARILAVGRLYLCGKKLTSGRKKARFKPKDACYLWDGEPDSVRDVKQEASTNAPEFPIHSEGSFSNTWTSRTSGGSAQSISSNFKFLLQPRKRPSII